MRLRDEPNEHGTDTTWFTCDTCGAEYSVTPAIPEGQEGWDNCMTPECKSYDPSRDIDILFMDKHELQNHHKLVDFDMLKKRKAYQAGEIDIKDITNN